MTRVGPSQKSIEYHQQGSTDHAKNAFLQQIIAVLCAEGVHIDEEILNSPWDKVPRHIRRFSPRYKQFDRLEDTFEKMAELYDIDIYNGPLANGTFKDLFFAFMMDDDCDGRLEFPVEDFVEYYDFLQLSKEDKSQIIPEIVPHTFSKEDIYNFETKTINPEDRYIWYAKNGDGGVALKHTANNAAQVFTIRPKPGAGVQITSQNINAATRLNSSTKHKLKLLQNSGSDMASFLLQQNGMTRSITQQPRSWAKQQQGSTRLLWNIAHRDKSVHQSVFGGDKKTWIGYMNDASEKYNAQLYIDGAKRIELDPGFVLIIRIGENTSLASVGGYSLGIDRFAEDMQRGFIDQGLLPEGFSYTPREMTNELSEDIVTANFKTTEEGAAAFCATLSAHHRELKKRLEKYNVKTEDNRVLLFLTYVSFNGGEGTVEAYVKNFKGKTITIADIKKRVRETPKSRKKAFYNAAMRLDIYLEYQAQGVFKGL